MARRTAERRDDKSKTLAERATMSVFDHLRELRDRILASLIAVAVGAIVCFILFEPIIDFMIGPYEDLTDKVLITTAPLEAFMTRLKVSAYGGVMIASPLLFWHLWRFITPGLHSNEKRYAVPFVFTSVILFVGGALVAILTFPRALDFLAQIGGDDIEPLYTAHSYLSLVFLLIISFGLAFEFPLLVAFLLLARILNTAQLRSWRRYAFLVIMIVAAIITPSQDPFTLFAMALPMYVLYEGAIVFGRLMKR